MKCPICNTFDIEIDTRAPIHFTDEHHLSPALSHQLAIAMLQILHVRSMEENLRRPTPGHVND